MDKEHINGMIRGNLLEIGRIIKWMVRVFLFGQMEGNMKGNIKMIKKKVMESLNGMEENNIKDIGKMGNNMEKDCYIVLKINLGEKDLNNIN